MPPKVEKPVDAYPVDKWLEKPYAARDDDDLPYDKYLYKDGESIGSIARMVSKPWHRVTTKELIEFNWGFISKSAHVNYFMQRYNGCTGTDHDDKAYKLAAADRNAFLWTPRPVRKFNGHYLSPGKLDVGHVALDDVKLPKHIDTLVIRPSYAITLELGDVDALFDPIAPGADPSGSEGVWQRLQVLGYHYIPLAPHAYPNGKRQSAMRIAWENYRKIHTPPGPDKRPPTNAELVAILKQEVQNNILSIAAGPQCAQSGKILEGRLPDPPTAASAPEAGAEGPARPAADEEFARIRIPGGYAATNGWYKGPHHDPSHVFGIGAERHDLEDAIVNNCQLRDGSFNLMNKIPLIATVHKIHPDGKEEPAEGVTVYFQLIPPTHPLPAGCAVKAPDLNDQEMNYADLGVGAGPATIGNTGPRRFVVDVFADQDLRYPTTDANDPQKHNADCVYGGKRRVAVQGGAVDGTNYDGVFEINAANRAGFHTRRDDKHADYGTLHRAEAITDAAVATDHPHAVKAKANDKGYAGVIFCPSRCGGDAYKLRAYVGPPTLEFKGDDPLGPVAETGTLVVWRNLRLHRYVQLVPPARAAVHADVEAIYAHHSNTTGHDFNWWWNSHGVAWPNAANPHPPKVNLTEPGAPGGGTVETQYPAADQRTLPWTFISLIEQFKRCYCEMIVDQRVKDGPNKGLVDRDPQQMTDQELMGAFNKAKAAARTHDINGKNINWDSLLIPPTSRSPWIFTLRHRKHANNAALRGAGDPIVPGDVTKICEALGYIANEAFIEYFTGDGVLGFSIIQSTCGATWDDIMNAEGALVLTSGEAGAGRGASMYYGDATYRAADFCYSATANAGHELGHTLTRQHQDPNPGGDPDHHQWQTDPTLMPYVPAAVPAPGTPPPHGARDVGEVTCLMGYQGCFGEFCGKCVLAFRGWKTGAAPLA